MVWWIRLAILKVLGVFQVRKGFLKDDKKLAI